MKENKEFAFCNLTTKLVVHCNTTKKLPTVTKYTIIYRNVYMATKSYIL